MWGPRYSTIYPYPCWWSIVTAHYIWLLTLTVGEFFDAFVQDYMYCITVVDYCLVVFFQQMKGSDNLWNLRSRWETNNCDKKMVKWEWCKVCNICLIVYNRRVSGQFRCARYKCGISACKQSNLCCYDGFCTNLCCANDIVILTGPREQNRGIWVG